MPDADLLETLGTPDVAIHAYGAEIEARHAERLRADLAVPAVEAAEVEVGIAVGQPSGFDRMRVVDQEQEDVTVRGVERRGVLGHFDERVVGHGRPVEQTRHLPARVASAVAGNPHHRLDQFVIPDAAIVGAGDGTQFDAAIIRLQRLHQFGAFRQQAVLEVDTGERLQAAGAYSWRVRRPGCTAGRRTSGSALPARLGRERSAPSARHCRGSPRRGAPWFRPYERSPAQRVRGRLRAANQARGKRSSSGRENHSDETRPIRSPRLMSTL